MARIFDTPTMPSIARSRLTRVTVVPALAALALGALTAATAPQAVAAANDYVAMGDSFAGGEGVPATVQEFDADSGSCHRAAGAWPRVLAAAKGLSLEATNAGHTAQTAGHIACTGASATTLLVGGNFGETAQLTQLKRLTPRPGLVTITVGASDARLFSVLLDCRTGIGCDTTISQARTTVRTKLTNRLANVFTQVRAASSARLIVVGYPQLYADPSTDAVGHCPGLTLGRLTELKAYFKDLDTATATAAKAAGAEYVSTLKVLAGHELCSTTPWVNDVTVSANALTAPSGHPTALGHAAIATRVKNYLTANPAAPNLAPKAAFTYKRKAGTTSRVVLDAGAAKDVDGRITTYVWKSGNTVLARGKVATITVARGTTLKVTLTVTDNRGAKVSLTRIVSASSTTPR